MEIARASSRPPMTISSRRFKAKRLAHLVDGRGVGWKALGSACPAWSCSAECADPLLGDGWKPVDHLHQHQGLLTSNRAVWRLFGTDQNALPVALRDGDHRLLDEGGRKLGDRLHLAVDHSVDGVAISQALDAHLDRRATTWAPHRDRAERHAGADERDWNAGKKIDAGRDRRDAGGRGRHDDGRRRDDHGRRTDRRGEVAVVHARNGGDTKHVATRAATGVRAHPDKDLARAGGPFDEGIRSASAVVVTGDATIGITNNERRVGARASDKAEVLERRARVDDVAWRPGDPAAAAAVHVARLNGPAEVALQHHRVWTCARAHLDRAVERTLHLAWRRTTTDGGRLEVVGAAGARRVRAHPDAVLTRDGGELQQRVHADRTTIVVAENASIGRLDHERRVDIRRSANGYLRGARRDVEDVTRHGLRVATAASIHRAQRHRTPSQATQHRGTVGRKRRRTIGRRRLRREILSFDTCCRRSRQRRCETKARSNVRAHHSH